MPSHEKTSKINGKRIKQELDEVYKDRTKVTMYLSKSLYREFKAKCRPHAASAVMQKLMEEFIEDLKS